ncbi:glycosyltransferase [Prevotella sp. HUN102]|uniref:glycosyltransferase n=1 Tax=Prevotella sp. HUN102 TaxID=1392486 RepID=UPI00048B5C97|nr:glycosyltransferase [Prevotella sp. HUN102]
MKILHYIDKLERDDLLSTYVSELAANEATLAEVKIITLKEDARQSMSDFNPDIVHIHACWSRKAYECLAAAIKQKRGTLYSPHWGLSPLSRKSEQPISKSIKQGLYQRKMVEKADAVLVTSKAEKDEIEGSGWTKRIDIVGASILNKNISATAMAENIVGIYDKVINTRYRKTVENAEIHALNALLHVGLRQEKQTKRLSSDDILALRKLTPQQWRKILLMADDENVREYVDIGAQRLQLDMPNIDTKAIIRYPSLSPKDDKELKDMEYSKRGDTEDAGEDLISIAHKLSNARKCIEKRQFSLRHLAEIYQTVRFEEYDEDKLAVVLKQQRIFKFSRRIIQVLQDYLYLEEGFMPFEPLDDDKTKTIEEKIINKEYY